MQHDHLAVFVSVEVCRVSQVIACTFREVKKHRNVESGTLPSEFACRNRPINSPTRVSDILVSLHHTRQTFAQALLMFAFLTCAVTGDYS